MNYTDKIKHPTFNLNAGCFLVKLCKQYQYQINTKYLF